MTSICVIGAGNVGTTLAEGLVRAGHRVTMGRRDPDAGSVVEGVPALDVVTAIDQADVVFNASPGASSVDLFAPLAEALGTRILVDVSNAAQPGTAVALQLALPAARVVKTLNTMLFLAMARPSALSGPATVFLSGDDASAKDAVRDLLTGLGWSSDQFLDLGGIDTAGSVEAAFPLAMAAVRAHGIAPFALSAVF